MTALAVGQERHRARRRLGDPLGRIEPVHLEKSDPALQSFDFLELVIAPQSALPEFLDLPRIWLLFGIIGDALGEELDTEVIVLADFSKMPGQHFGKFLAARDRCRTPSSLDVADRLLHLFCDVRIDVDLEDLLDHTVDDGRPLGPVDGAVDFLAVRGRGQT